MLLRDWIKIKSDRKSQLSFLGLLLLFLAYFLVGPMLPSSYEKVFVNVSFSLLLLSVIFTMSYRRVLLISAVLFGMVAIVLNSMTLVYETYWFELCSVVISTLFIGVITVILFRRVFFASAADVDLVYGAICIYILLGVFWAQIYAFIELLVPNSFQVSQALLDHLGHGLQNSNVKLQSFLYFSFVTQTTLGYGDISPVLPVAKHLSALQAIMGQFYIAILVAGLVGVLTQKKLKSP